MFKFVLVVGDRSGVLVGHLYTELSKVYKRDEFRAFGLLRRHRPVAQKDPRNSIHEIITCGGQLAIAGWENFPHAQLYVGVQGGEVPPFPKNKPFVGAWAGNKRGPAGILSLSVPAYDKLFQNVCVYKNSFIGTSPATLGIATGDTLDKVAVLIAFLKETLKEMDESA